MDVPTYIDSFFIGFSYQLEFIGRLQNTIFYADMNLFERDKR